MAASNGLNLGFLPRRLKLVATVLFFLVFDFAPIVLDSKLIRGATRDTSTRKPHNKNLPLDAQESLHGFTASNDIEMSPTPSRSGNHSLFGWYLDVYKQPKATLEVVKSIAHHMPDTPIYMLSSGGYHFDPLAARYSETLTYEYSSEEQDVRLGFKKRNVKHWFQRIATAAAWCNCDYLVLMQEDTLVRKALKKAPPHDAGGTTAHQRPPGVYKKSSHEPYGMGGGSYVRVEAFLDAYSKTNWARMEAMSSTVKQSKRFNDGALAMIMMEAGYTLLPWGDLTQQSGQRKRSNPNAAIVHNFKDFYGQPLSEEDGLVVTEQV